MLETNFPLKTPERVQAIEAWWAAFQDTENAINAMFSDGVDFDLTEFMWQNLEPIHPGMMWEFGPGRHKNHVLAIAPEADRTLIPLAALMLEWAPECQFFEFRLNRDVTLWDQYAGLKDGRVTWDSPKGIMFTFEIGKHNLIDLKFYTKLEHQDDRTEGNCFVMAETLLGEDVMQNWVGYVDVEEEKTKRVFQRRKGQNIPEYAQSVAKLREAVVSEIAKIKNGLPKQPLFSLAESHEWNLLRMEPEERNDYARMDDLIAMPLLNAGPSISLYNGQTRFASERFSGLGETFVFVKIDGSADDYPLETVEDRGAIEDAINAALNPLALGGVIGGGTGLRYSYIMLAVTELPKAIKVIIETLRALKMSRRSWIMFNDHYREQEWIGVWEDSPEPLLPVYGE